MDYVACRLTSKIIGISDENRSWGDYKTIKYVKYNPSVVMHQRNRPLYINLLVFKMIYLNVINLVKHK